MPVNRKMMKSMKEQYGPEKGERIYYAKELHSGKEQKMMNKKKMGYAKGGMASDEEIKPGKPKRLKEVPADNPGLAKLPEKVRNGMGYLNKGGMASKKMGYAEGGMVKANCGASVKPNRTSRT